MKKLLALLLLAACQPANNTNNQTVTDTASATVADTTSPGVKACELVTSDDVSRVTGVAYKTGVVTNDYAGDSQCRFDRNDTTKASVMVTLHKHGRMDPYRLVPGSIPVSDVGDEAFWNADHAQLAIRKGEAIVSISFLAAPAQKRWATALARTALPRL